MLVTNVGALKRCYCTWNTNRCSYIWLVHLSVFVTYLSSWLRPNKKRQEPKALMIGQRALQFSRLPHEKKKQKLALYARIFAFCIWEKNGPRFLQRESETKKTLRRGDSVGLTPMPQISAFMGIDRSVVGEYSFNYQLSMNVRLLVPIILRRHTHLIRYYWKSLPLIKFQCCSLFLLLHSCYYISNSMGLESTFIPFQGNQSCPNFTSQIKNHALILIGSSC